MNIISKYLDILNNEGILLNSPNFIIDSHICNLTYNSKDVSIGTMFFCKGVAFKEQYLLEAITNGAICYVSEKVYNVDFPCILVNNIRKAMAILAVYHSEYAFSKLCLTGITGTKGKTTTAYYIKYILDCYLKAQDKPLSGLCSSIEVFDGNKTIEAELTTPEAILLNSYLKTAVDNELSYFTMEVSSQALKYYRVLGITFDIAVFLNISCDHISPIEHPDFDDYFHSKLKILNQTKLSIINIDSDYSDIILNSAKKTKIITFGTKSNADFYIYNIKKIADEITFSVRHNDFDESFSISMAGLFNVENAVAAMAVAHSYSIPLHYIRKGLSNAKVNGRMEIYKSSDNKIKCIVDYAHNKLSFERLFSSALQEYPDHNIIAVFGCPGGKAFNRREELGVIASKYCDAVYITTDNPNNELVSAINDEIAKFVQLGTAHCYIIEDRKEAIKTAINSCTDKSIILIAGKGNEDFQIIKGQHIKCESDATIVRNLLQ